MRAAQMLKAAAYPEAAGPLATLVNDPEDEVQLEAIAAELNIFLAEKIVTRKRVGLLVEVRNAIAAEAAFSQGPLSIGSRPVPSEVLTALLKAARDTTPRVALEALYAFGTLAVAPGGGARRDLLRASGADLAAMIGVVDPVVRYAAVRVLGRVFEKRPQDEPIDQVVGDALITVLNDRDKGVKVAATEALGSIRYERSVQSLTDLFQYHGRGDLAGATLNALARIAHPASAPVFEAQLAVRNGPFRGIAIEGLARLGEQASLPDIEAALSSERNDTVLLTGAFASAMLANGPVDPIIEALSRARLHDQAKQYLIELFSRRFPVFGRFVQDPDARIRADIADVIGLAFDPAALSFAESLMKDGDPQVARAGERALARLRTAGQPPGS